MIFSRKSTSSAKKATAKQDKATTQKDTSKGSTRKLFRKAEKLDETRDEIHPITSFLDYSYSATSDSLSYVYSEARSMMSKDEEDTVYEEDRNDEVEVQDQTAGRKQKAKKVKGNAFTLARLLRKLEKQECKLEMIGEKFHQTEENVFHIQEQIGDLTGRNKVGNADKNIANDHDDVLEGEVIIIPGDEVADSEDRDESIDGNENDDEIGNDNIVSDYFHDDSDDEVTLSGQVGDALKSGKELLTYAGSEMFRLGANVEQAATNAIFPKSV